MALNKLKNLGIDLGLFMTHKPQVVTNLSNRLLTTGKLNLHNKGLDFAFFLYKISILFVTTEFEYICYFELQYLTCVYENNYQNQLQLKKTYQFINNLNCEKIIKTWR